MHRFFYGSILANAMPNRLRTVGVDEARNSPLLKRGYSAQDVQKIVGGNLLRVFAEVERVSREEKPSDDKSKRFR